MARVLRRERRANNLVEAGGRFTIANVVGNAPGEEIDVLMDDADAAAQRTEGDLANIPAVEQDGSLVNLVKARGRQGYRGQPLPLSDALQ